MLLVSLKGYISQCSSSTLRSSLSLLFAAIYVLIVFFLTTMLTLDASITHNKTLISGELLFIKDYIAVGCIPKYQELSPRVL